MRRLLGLFCLYVFVSVPAASQVQCGGTERWRPKVGTDPQVDQVTVNQPVPIELHDLIQLPEPVLPNDNINRVAPDETKVYTVRAFMVQFKLEPNDSDYHIVVTDDTHQFTDHQGNHIGHSVVTEIPDPGCLEGKDSNFPGSTPFADAISAARALMDARFPNALKDGSFNPVNLPVEITAVGFFDHAHGQIRRAANNVELHPSCASASSMALRPSAAPQVRSAVVRQQPSEWCKRQVPPLLGRCFCTARGPHRLLLSR